MMEEKKEVGYPRVAVCCVTWNAQELTIRCLESIYSELERLPGAHMILVDNGSDDGSREKVADAISRNGWDDRIRFTGQPENRGFASGINIALRTDLESESPSDYLFITNPDTVLRPNAISVLVEFLESHPEVGIAGGRCEEPDGSHQVCSFRFSGILDEFSRYLRLGILDKLLENKIGRVAQSEKPLRVDWVSGATMLVRRQVFEDVGLLDDGYFLYFEESDFALKAFRAGWTCWHVPDSCIVHILGHATGVTNDRGAGRERRPKYWFDSRRRYFLKNYGKLFAATVDLAALTGLCLGKIRDFVLRRENPNPPKFGRDLLRNSVFVRGCRY